MRKLLLLSTAALALAGATVASRPAAAQTPPLGDPGISAEEAGFGGALALPWLYGVVLGPVVKDIANGGLNRKFAEVVPAQPYNVAMTGRLSDRAQQIVAEFDAAMKPDEYASAK